ncbi:MAG: phosphate acetyltransferase [Abditibacteriota bacterium]|nr:phosphate acetyltransferase [Abditibacteriota bacterium]
MHPYIEFLIDKASKLHGKVAVPDGQFDERVLEACVRVHKAGWLDVVMVGSRAEYEKMASKFGFDITGMTIVDPDETDEFADYCKEYGVMRAKENLTPEQIEAVLREPVALAMMLVKHGKVDGVCSGVYYSTADVARPAIKILGLQKGVSKMTALGVMIFEDTPIGKNLVYCAADGTILPNPTAEELAEIAILATDKAKAILPSEPLTAMLSFSTCGSAKHEMVDKVTTALKIANEKRPDLKIDGEFQLDTAISPRVAEKKMKRPSEVAGKANVLIWPDLQAGNMVGKGMMIMGSGMLVGATFLGLNGFVNDHSRGATVDEIVTNIAFVGAQIEENK